jgi:hypothetical protein
MPHEALYGAVLGAAPTVLIAYILEYRWTTRKPAFGHKVLAGVIITANGLAALSALTALGVGEPADAKSYAYLVTGLFALGICGLLAELAEGVIRGLTSSE